MPIIGSLAGASSRGLGGLGTFVLATSSGSFESIASYKLGTNSASFDFTSIPSTYAHLQIRIYSRNTGNDNKFKLTFNGDSTDSNYYNQAFYSGSGAMGGWSYNYPWIGYGPESSNNSSLFSGYTIDIHDYANANKKKNTRSIGGYGVVSGGYFWYQNHSWVTAAVINRIEVTSLGTAFGTGSVCSLYGIKGS